MDLGTEQIPVTDVTSDAVGPGELIGEISNTGAVPQGTVDITQTKNYAF